jgi:hypothetical protein
MIKIKALILFFVVFSSYLCAEEQKQSSLHYFKVGGVLPPNYSSVPMPNIGLGARYQKGHYGVDL